MSARVSTSGTILLAALAGLSPLTLTYGQIALPLADTVGALTGTQSTDLARQIVLEIRLPRVAAAVIAGGALGIAGVLMQTLFRNPVADACVAIAAFAMLALGRRVGAITLLVIGLMLGFTSQGLTSVLLHFAARAGGRVYGGWQDASFAGVDPEALPWLGLPILIGTCAAVATAKPLSSLLLGETCARSLGVRVTSLRHAVLAATVLVVAPVVAFCGPVSFVGLIARALAGTARIPPLLPLAALGGALLALAGDAIIHAPWEQHFLHLNAILAIVGAPAVILILIFSPAVRQWR